MRDAGIYDALYCRSAFILLLVQGNMVREQFCAKEHDGQLMISYLSFIIYRDSLWAMSTLGAACLRTAKDTELSFMRTVSLRNKLMHEILRIALLYFCNLSAFTYSDTIESA